MIIVQSSNIRENVGFYSSNKQKVRSTKKRKIENALLKYMKYIIEICYIE